MNLHELSPAAGSNTKAYRKGRGAGSGNGKTAGRGHKGQWARSGGGVRVGFEGGQMPLARRLPKRGFNNPNHVLFEVVNLSTLEKNFESGAEVNREILLEKGLVSKEPLPLKILANGELTKALKVSADRFSGQAKAKIEAVGGSVEEKMPTHEEDVAAKKARHFACKNKKKAVAALAAATAEKTAE